MGNSEMARIFQVSSVVVEVQHGESQDDAWGRYLATNPEGARASVKIFHYPGPVSRRNNHSDILQWRRRENRV